MPEGNSDLTTARNYLERFVDRYDALIHNESSGGDPKVHEAIRGDLNNLRDDVEKFVKELKSQDAG